MGESGPDGRIAIGTAPPMLPTAPGDRRVRIGALIVFFLIGGPRGLARLGRIGTEKLRRWPFP